MIVQLLPLMFGVLIGGAICSYLIGFIQEHIRASRAERAEAEHFVGFLGHDADEWVIITNAPCFDSCPCRRDS